MCLNGLKFVEIGYIGLNESNCKLGLSMFHALPILTIEVQSKMAKKHRGKIVGLVKLHKKEHFSVLGSWDEHLLHILRILSCQDDADAG